MTAVCRSLWPEDPYTVAVLRKYSPGMLLAVAEWLLSAAARLAAILAPLPAPPAVPTAAAVVAVDGPFLAWSAPAGADFMMTGPPCPGPRGSPCGAGRALRLNGKGSGFSPLVRS